jgi:hypothetical protein
MKKDLYYYFTPIVSIAIYIVIAKYFIPGLMPNDKPLRAIGGFITIMSSIIWVGEGILKMPMYSFETKMESIIYIVLSAILTLIGIFAIFYDLLMP